MAQAEDGRLVRRRVGVAHYPDGWNVIVEVDGRKMVYNPAYPTETEALAKADEVAKHLRSVGL